MTYAFLGRDENGRRYGGKFRFTLVELMASSGLLMIVIGVTMAILTSDSLALVPGLTYAVAVVLAGMVYRHYLSIRLDSAAMAEAAERADADKRSAQFRMDVHPLLETGWEDELAMHPVEWVDMPTATFKVVGSRGICPRGMGQGDFVEVGADGSVSPGLCAEAEAVLCMASEDHSEVREWCCPVYDHLLVFKKLDKVY